MEHPWGVSKGMNQEGGRCRKPRRQFGVSQERIPKGGESTSGNRSRPSQKGSENKP